MRCKICGKESGSSDTCKKCSYFLKHGNDEESLKAMYDDKDAQKAWEEDETLADELTEMYYDSLLDSYGEKWIKKVDKKVLGFNTFADGTRAGLDIIMPLLDDEMREKVKQRVQIMKMNANVRLVRKGVAKSERPLSG